MRWGQRPACEGPPIQGEVSSSLGSMQPQTRSEPLERRPPLLTQGQKTGPLDQEEEEMAPFLFPAFQILPQPEIKAMWWQPPWPLDARGEKTPSL